MANMFVYEGELDQKGVTLPLTTVGPSFTEPGKMATFQDVLEMHADGRRGMYSQTKNEDGTWTRFMTARYTRVK